MSEIYRIWKALTLATTNLPEDRQDVLDAFKATKDLSAKLVRIRDALVEADAIFKGEYAHADKAIADSIDLIDSINGV